MIQRIQSLYMLLWPLVALLITSLFPLWTADQNVLLGDVPELYALVIVSGVLTVISIFLFKKRKAQIVLNRFNLVLMLALFPTLLFLKTGFDMQGLVFGNAAFLPLPAAIFLLLANRAIKKDEALIRSMDRLR